MLHQVIETLNARVALRSRYDNFIGGKWVAPVDGQYFDNISPITGKPVCQIARSQAADIELALDAAHKAKDAWGNMAPAKRAEILNMVADQIHHHHDRHRRLLGRLEHHAVAGGERWRKLPRRHQDGEVPRDNLADDAERLVIMIGNGFVIDL